MDILKECLGYHWIRYQFKNPDSELGRGYKLTTYRLSKTEYASFLSTLPLIGNKIKTYKGLREKYGIFDWMHGKPLLELELDSYEKIFEYLIPKSFGFSLGAASGLLFSLVSSENYTHPDVGVCLENILVGGTLMVALTRASKFYNYAQKKRNKWKEVKWREQTTETERLIRTIPALLEYDEWIVSRRGREGRL